MPANNVKLNMAYKKMLENLNKEIDKIEGKTVKGLSRAGLKIKREALKNTPKDTGNLRGSAYVIWKGSDGSISGDNLKYAGEDTKSRLADEKLGVVIGYGAEYAIFVHEMNKNYVVGSWKYLIKAIQDNQNEIIDQIVKHVKRD